MLHWRRKVLHGLKRQFFWVKLFFVSFLVHLFMVFFVLFLYKGTNYSYDIMISSKVLNSGAPVIFLPLHKIVKSSPINKPSNSKVVTSKKKLKKNVTLTVVPLKTKKASKKVVKKEIKKKVKAKSIAKKKKLIAKKEIKKPVKKIVEKKLLSKVVSKKVKEKVDMPIYVGQAQMDALDMQKQVYSEVSKYWKPPSGFSKDLVCTLKLLVDWSGFIKEVIVEKASGVLMYDISARTAVAKINLPKLACGKEFSITFKQ